jgi:hypothetical protein
MNSGHRPSALLVLDVFNTFDFPGGDDLFKQVGGQVLPGFLSRGNRMFLTVRAPA